MNLARRCLVVKNVALQNASVAAARRSWLRAREITDEQIMIVNLSGRGDKDVDTVRSQLTTEDTEKTGDSK